MGGAGRWRVGVSGVAGDWPPAGQRSVPRCSFPPPGSALDCAVSGGPDSLALLVLAAAAGCAVTAIHVDHGLRAGSDAEAAVVARAAALVGARFVAEKVSVGAGPNLEARARAARFAVLPPGVATGHTMDDQAETILLNLLRGSGADGLAGMEPGPRHPLLGLRRHETHAVCAAMGLEPVRDPSNDDPAFLRNRVRHELLPLCADVAGRDPVPLLARQAGVLRDEVALLNELAREAAPDPERRPGAGRPAGRPGPAGGTPMAPGRRGVLRGRRTPTRRRRPRWNGCWRSPPGERWPPNSPGAAGCPGGAGGCRSSRTPRIVSPR